jgi:nucleoside-diphosphate-sugar epimerase
VVEANLKACTAPAAGVVGEVFNVGCGERISVNRLWNLIRSLTGAEVDAAHGAVRPGDVRDSLADLSRIRARLGYQGAIDLEDGLGRTVAWLRESRAR